jgi:hypothetical protein
MSCQCSICKTGLSEARYKCGICDITLCRGCFRSASTLPSVTSPNATTSNSIVHNVHPTHPFLDMKVKPKVKHPSETLHHLEISEGITVAEDDAEDSRDSRQRKLIYPRRFPLTLCFLSSSKARRIPMLKVRVCLNRLDIFSLMCVQLQAGHCWFSVRMQGPGMQGHQR